MIFDEPGTYQIEYTATDECGNETVADRTVIVEAPPTYRTVLYTDGTFIINESSRDEAHNIAQHGVATNVYPPFNPDSQDEYEKYIFYGSSGRYWDAEASSVLSIEIGSNISPTQTAYWFYGMTQCTSADFSNLDTSAVLSMEQMFYDCQAITIIDLSDFNTNSVKTMRQMFMNCTALTSLDLSGFNTSSLTNMLEMFRNCTSLVSVNLSSFDTSNVTNMNGIFKYCQSLTVLDLSNFDTSAVTNTSEMFRNCNTMTTIYASTLFVLSDSVVSGDMFRGMSSSLVGGAGTVWSSSYTNGARAHIDGGTADPGYFTAKS